MHTHFTTPLLAAVQIITESLPISSSTHLQLVAHLLQINLSTTIPPQLNYLLHGPMIIIIIIFFRNDWLAPFATLIKSLQQSYTLKKITASASRSLTMLIKISTLVIVATIITVLFYYIKETCLENIWLQSKSILLAGLSLTSIALLSTYCCTTKKLKQPLFTTIKIPLKIGAILGVVQGMALLPGISRFGATYVAALWLGFTSRRAFQISFLIELPVIMAGFLVKGLLPMLKSSEAISMMTNVGWIIIALACIASYIALWCAWKLAHRNLFWIFGIYVLVLAIILL